MLRPILLTLLIMLTLSAPASASPYSADYRPSGSFSATKAKGTILMIHGGAWFLVGPEAAKAMEPNISRFTNRGWAVRNISYGAGPQSLPDVIAAYDKLKRERGGKICAFGISAGGHLAMLLAAHRPIDCVIAEAAPTDCLTIGEPIKKACDSFFANNGGLSTWSPARQGEKITSPILLVMAKDDPLVPYQQGLIMKRLVKKTKLISLKAGTTPFGHSPVDRRQRIRSLERERALLAREAKN